VPEAGEWGCLHPGFLLALGLDPNLNPYHDTLTTFTALKGETKQAHVIAGRACTPYEVRVCVRVWWSQQLVAALPPAAGAWLCVIRDRVSHPLSAQVLRDLVVDYLHLHPSAKLYVTGHSLGE
jgi:hypothetical protein